MAELVFMPKSDWQAALDATREKTDDPGLIKSSQLADRIRSIRGEGGGGNGAANYEVVKIASVSDPAPNFKTPGTSVEVYGFGKGSGTGFQQPTYTFLGDKYVSRMGGSETSMTLSVDSSGRITGLPAITTGEIIAMRKTK